MRDTRSRHVASRWAATAIVLGMATTAIAQHGTGHLDGVAAAAIKPEVVTLSGKLVEIRTARCEASTGRLQVGTHITLQTSEGRALKIHLGPADRVADSVGELTVGQDMSVQAFQTEDLRPDDYVARSIRTRGKQIELRDSSLRPFWAGGQRVTPGPARVQGRFAMPGGRRRGPGMGMGQSGPGSGACCGMGSGGGRGVAAGENQGSATAPHGMGMSVEEHDNILALLSHHASITRKVEQIPGGVKTTTTSSRPELVDILRSHVRQMSSHLEQGQPVRMWDPVFRDIFAHHDEIHLATKDVEGGIEVIETSENSEVVPLIRAHASKVNEFVAQGHAAARPPWAGAGGRWMRGRR